MKKINKFLLKYLVYASPAIVFLIIWNSIQNQQQIIALDNMFISAIWHIFSWHLILWFIVMVYLLCILLISADFRTQLLTKLAKIKERDERESYITGKASRYTFFSTLALLLFLLFLFSINISITKLPALQAINGNRFQLSIGLSVKALEPVPLKNRAAHAHIFSTQNFPLSKSTVIFILIIWHMGSFYFFSKKEKME